MNTAALNMFVDAHIHTPRTYIWKYNSLFGHYLAPIKTEKNKNSDWSTFRKACLQMAHSIQTEIYSHKFINKCTFLLWYSYSNGHSVRLWWWCALISIFTHELHRLTREMKSVLLLFHSNYLRSNAIIFFLQSMRTELYVCAYAYE